MNLNELIGTNKNTLVVSWRKASEVVIEQLLNEGWIWRNRRERVLIDHGKMVYNLTYEQGYEKMEGQRWDHIILIGDPPRNEFYTCANIMGAECTHISERELNELG